MPTDLSCVAEVRPALNRAGLHRHLLALGQGLRNQTAERMDLASLRANHQCGFCSAPYPFRLQRDLREDDGQAFRRMCAKEKPPKGLIRAASFRYFFSQAAWLCRLVSLDQLA